MSDYYTIVLQITCDDPEDDPRLWPFDDMLAPPAGETPRYVQYVHGVKEARGDD